MPPKTSSTPHETVAQNIETLHCYAIKALVHHEKLTEEEQKDKATRVNELLEIGSSFKLTQREITTLVFKGVLREQKRCGCSACTARESRKP